MSGQFDDDAVGYGRPPRASQFAKGKSGNPKGRPRRSSKPSVSATDASEWDDIFRAELAKTVTVREGGKLIRLNKLKLTFKAQLASAAKGNAVAQREVLKLAQELEIRDNQRALDERERELRIFECIRNWRDVRIREWAEAAKRGCEPDEIWPHTDDIMIDEDQRHSYRETNKLMKPILKRFGYRSLAEFERAYREKGEAMEWPRRVGQSGGAAVQNR